MQRILIAFLLVAATSLYAEDWKRGKAVDDAFSGGPAPVLSPVEMPEMEKGEPADERGEEEPAYKKYLDCAIALDGFTKQHFNFWLERGKTLLVPAKRKREMGFYIFNEEGASFHRLDPQPNKSKVHKIGKKPYFYKVPQSLTGSKNDSDKLPYLTYTYDHKRKWDPSIILSRNPYRGGRYNTTLKPKYSLEDDAFDAFRDALLRQVGTADELYRYALETDEEVPERNLRIVHPEWFEKENYIKNLNICLSIEDKRLQEAIESEIWKFQR